ncbi:hypothetical protein NEF87_001908 [Candidatus Lokiarchaeum ossiferum]|uniref:Uncharacterized protein n=1 Tax=Candidatus Lokiarchaeum ossiferum TaxID=2951803 RepID=A0ABY6HQ32_9ARCH|nr:hypothetical protein NEF87_001908 [Candidatus Lokiarchaeum sp. B-35]
MSNSLFFLFSEKISPERLEWISLIQNFSKNTLTIGITGDALYSFTDQSLFPEWESIIRNQRCNIHLDQWEAEIRGITIKSLTKNYKISSLTNIKLSKNIKIGFWDAILQLEEFRNFKDNYMGFLQMKGPYMSRNSVYAVNFLESSLKNKKKAQLLCYLDGVHTGHINQAPSEFENIGRLISMYTDPQTHNNQIMETLACSRCCIARGYGEINQNNEEYKAKSVIDGFRICNLNEIVDQFERSSPIFAPNVGMWINSTEKKFISSPEILLMMTHTPYQEEFTFGGLSFAMACANHGIHVSILFVEDGIYNLVGEHKIHSQDHVFNIQEIVDVTWEMDKIDYYIYTPSILRRNVSINGYLNFVNPLSTEELQLLISKHTNQENSNMGRIIFF